MDTNKSLSLLDEEGSPARDAACRNVCSQRPACAKTSFSASGAEQSALSRLTAIGTHPGGTSCHNGQHLKPTLGR